MVDPVVDIPVIALFAAAIVSGFVGALLGGMLVVRSLRKGHLAVRSVELPRRLVSLDSLSFTIAIKAEGDRIVAKTTQDINHHGITAEVVQDWLDENDLVAQFKGRDFKAPTQAGNRWQKTR